MRCHGPTPDEVAADAEAPAHVAHGDADRSARRGLGVNLRPPQGALPLGGGGGGDDDFSGEDPGGHAPAPSFVYTLRAPAPPERAAPTAPPGTRFFESAGARSGQGRRRRRAPPRRPAPRSRANWAASRRRAWSASNATTSEQL